MIYLRTIAQIRIVVPLVTAELKIPSEMLIAETIIVGDVPRFYMNNQKEGFKSENL